MEGAEDAEIISITFEGGLADTGKLHFYEFGRSQYALARFIATVEHFRRSGEIADHIGRSSYVDIIVSSPEHGSFIESLIVPALEKAGISLISAKLSSLISYVWHLIFPRREKTDQTIVELAKIRLKESRETTEQMRALERIISGEQANTQSALRLVEWALSAPNPAIGRLEISREDFFEIQSELEAEQKRTAEFADDADELRKLDEDTLNRLTSRLRPMIPEMTLPLRKSAKKMKLATKADRRTFMYVNQDIANNIKEKKTEEKPTNIEGRVKSYDRDSGVGKFSSKKLQRPLNFIVPIGDRGRLLDKILAAMKKEKVKITCRRIVDKSRMPTSLILMDILD